MADIETPEKPIVISEDDARGGLAPEETTVGDTLLPTMFWAIGLTVVGFLVTAIVIYARAQ